jgi:hypothetical protein
VPHLGGLGKRFLMVEQKEKCWTGAGLRARALGEGAVQIFHQMTSKNAFLLGSNEA